MKIRLILLVITLGLSLYLFFDNFLQIDIAATKNHALMMQNKQEIDSMNNISAIKQKAKNEIDINWRNHRRDSDRASAESWIFLLLIIFQIAAIALNRK